VTTTPPFDNSGDPSDDDGGSLTPRQRRRLTKVYSDRTIVAVLAGIGFTVSLLIGDLA
jgi:hypothetical protein